MNYKKLIVSSTLLLTVLCSVPSFSETGGTYTPIHGANEAPGGQGIKPLNQALKTTHAGVSGATAATASSMGVTTGIVVGSLVVAGVVAGVAVAASTGGGSTGVTVH